MKLTIIRHGQTPGNRKKRYIGSTDEPLFDKTAINAVKCCVSHIYVSPMLRAVQTAERLFPSVEQIKIPGFIEINFGEFENKSAEDMKDDARYLAWEADGCTSCSPGGEDFEVFVQRSCAAFAKLIKDAASNNEDEVIIVAHGGTIMAIMNRCVRPTRPYFDWYVNNCCGYTANLPDSICDAMPTITDWTLRDFLRENEV